MSREARVTGPRGPTEGTTSPREWRTDERTCIYCGKHVALECWAADGTHLARTRVETAMHRLYVASRSRHGPMWRALRDNTCLPIVSTWIDESEPGQTTDYGDLMRRCIEEASCATAFICYAEGDDCAGWKGVWFEMGAACAAGVPVFFVGTHDFPSALRHPNVTFCESLDAALALALNGPPS